MPIVPMIDDRFVVEQHSITRRFAMPHGQTTEEGALCCYAREMVSVLNGMRHWMSVNRECVRTIIPSDTFALPVGTRQLRAVRVW